MEGEHIPARIICVDDGKVLAEQVKTIFDNDDVTIAYERNLEAVVDRFERNRFDLMLFSGAVARNQQADALDVLELISVKCPQTQILLFTAPGSLKFANQGLRAGAYHYATLPITSEELKLLIGSAMEAKPLLGPNMLLKAETEKNTFERMVGRSAVMQAAYRLIRQAAVTDIPVLISGETGTGKELAAQAIHQLSARNDASCIPVHIASLPPDLVASELFGHVSGAFTGATKMRKGCFEMADGGTVFLDEIGTIDQKMQVSLLRLLETNEFSRIGSQENMPVNVRVIAATNADLVNEIRLGNFREDLYYRLDVLNIVMPPLRDRSGDIPLLVSHFIKEASEDFKKKIRGLSSDFINCVESYPWPGNVRELRNVIQRAVVSATEDILRTRNLPNRISHYQDRDNQMTVKIGMTLAQVEKGLIIRTLAHAGDNRSRTSEILGISRRTLYNKMERYGISTVNSSG
ncbi:sigma-54 dependent transcriptional regulator [Desulfobacula sp.]|uniref:sigma-54-dependent transcriptional regulator n=1 Tax=Desulfobacula sp. TaxID=2593537 RepID=UPI002626532C|nr:sigma-54 dependent transcriptional regulator [Desulfobacula sp.]